MKTIKETVDYIYDYINQADSSADLPPKDALQETIEEEVLDTVEDILSEDEFRKLMRDADDDNHIDNFLSSKFGKDYDGLLLEIQNELLSEYMLAEKKSE